MSAIFNEFEPYAAAWLRNLISAGHIAHGDIDERSIVDLRPADLAGRSQVHLFAGIGVWSHALRRAGWPDDRPVWTASFPCQPFSAAGKRKGTADERHLWPVGFELIRACRPPVLIGEQVASPDGLGWWDTVSADLEAEDYTCRAFDLCAPGVGAPHIRQRLYWVAYSDDAGLEGRRQSECERAVERPVGARGVACGLGHAERIGAGRDTGAGACPEGEAPLRPVGDDARSPSATRGLADTDEQQWYGVGDKRTRRRVEPSNSGGDRRPGPTNGFWRDADWLGCRDGKWRPVEPGTFPLAHGAPARVEHLRAGEASPFREIIDPETGRSIGQAPWRAGMLRAYGNAIVAPLAQVFIEEVMAALES